MTFCLTASRNVLGLGEPDALAAVFEDLPRRRLAYWHDAPIAALRTQLLGGDQGEWLERLSNYMVGITLGDTSEGRLYLCPGSGGVDYPLLASYKVRHGRPMPAVLELATEVASAELPSALAFLAKFGL
jgi:hypothetical protein